MTAGACVLGGPDPDLFFHFDGDPDQDLAPQQIDASSDLVYRPSRLYIHIFRAPFLHFEPPQLLNFFEYDAYPDPCPALDFYSEPEPAFQDVDPDRQHFELRNLVTYFEVC